MSSADPEPTLEMRDGSGAPPSPPQEGSRLIVVSGARPGDRVSLDAETVTIGRDDSNDLVLPSSVVSAFHARVVRRRSTHTIQDTDSTNGVRVNGAPVPPDGAGRQLRHGDVVTISDHTLLFVARPSAADLADFSSIRIDKTSAAREAEALLEEFPQLRNAGDGR